MAVSPRVVQAVQGHGGNEGLRTSGLLQQVRDMKEKASSTVSEDALQNIQSALATSRQLRVAPAQSTSYSGSQLMAMARNRG